MNVLKNTPRLLKFQKVRLRPAFWHCLIRWGAAPRSPSPFTFKWNFVTGSQSPWFLNPRSASKNPIKSEWLLLLLSATGPISLVTAQHMSLLILSRSKHSLLLHILYSGHARFSPQTNNWKTSAFRFRHISCLQLHNSNSQRSMKRGAL